MSLKVPLVHDLHFGESPLPDLALESKLMRQPIRETPFDKLHDFLYGHVPANFDQEMDVVGHDYEIAQFELSLGDKRTQDIDEKVGIALGLQQSPAHASFRRSEKDARWIQNVCRSGVAGWMRHSRG